MDIGSKDKQKAINEERRRVSKVVTASPILASLASPSVWGTVCSVSGLQSGNTSGHQHDKCGGNGCTPGYWKNHPKAWPPLFSPGTCKDSTKHGCKSWSYDDSCSPIRDILPDGVHVGDFGHKHYSGTYTDDTAIMYILQREVEQSGNTNSHLAHWIAAVFNAIVAPDIYGTSLSNLIDAAEQAVSGTGNFTLGELCDVLARMNESGDCFLSGGNKYSNLGCQSYNGVDYMYWAETGTCIPVCGRDAYDMDTAYDWKTKTCVPLGQETSYTDWCAGDGAGSPECTGDWTF